MLRVDEKVIIRIAPFGMDLALSIVYLATPRRGGNSVNLFIQ
jgi:hypothetical protein